MLGTYDPEIPLDQAVENAAIGLQPVPASLRTMGVGLRQTSQDLVGAQRGFTLMVDQVMAIREDLIDADTVLSAHRTTVQQLWARVQSVQKNAGQPIQAVAWATTLLIIGIGLARLPILRWRISLWERPAATRVKQHGGAPTPEESQSMTWDGQNNLHNTPD